MSREIIAATLPPIFDGCVCYLCFSRYSADGKKIASIESAGYQRVSDPRAPMQTELLCIPLRMLLFLCLQDHCQPGMILVVGIFRCSLIADVCGVVLVIIVVVHFSVSTSLSCNSSASGIWWGSSVAVYRRVLSEIGTSTVESSTPGMTWGHIAQDQ